MIPSCMRAPPEAVNNTTGNFSAVAYSNKRVIFSPTTVPIDAIIKLESMMPRATFSPLIKAVPVTTASSRPVFSRIKVNFLR